MNTISIKTLKKKSSKESACTERETSMFGKLAEANMATHFTYIINYSLLLYLKSKLIQVLKN